MAGSNWDRQGWTGFTPAVRARILARDPICRGCRRARSTQADHIIPRAEGGSHLESNGQGLCGACHTEKTRAEQKRGRERRAQTKPRTRPTGQHPGVRGGG